MSRDTNLSTNSELSMLAAFEIAQGELHHFRIIVANADGFIIDQGDIPDEERWVDRRAQPYIDYLHDKPWDIVNKQIERSKLKYEELRRKCG